GRTHRMTAAVADRTTTPTEQETPAPAAGTPAPGTLAPGTPAPGTPRLVAVPDSEPPLDDEPVGGPARPDRQAASGARPRPATGATAPTRPRRDGQQDQPDRS